MLLSFIAGTGVVTVVLAYLHQLTVTTVTFVAVLAFVSVGLGILVGRRSIRAGTGMNGLPLGLGYGIVRTHPNQDAAAGEIRKYLGAVTSVDVLTIRGLGIFGLKDSLLRSQLSDTTRQITTRILYLSPSSDFVEIRAREIGENTNTFRQGIILAEQSLITLQQTEMLGLQAAAYDALPIWRLIRVDKHMFVSAFLPRMDGHRSPVLELIDDSGDSVYHVFMRYFDDLWKRSCRTSSTTASRAKL